MTTEEKARAYDEALEKAKIEINTKGIGETVNLCKHLFPELTESDDEESDDERIRKAALAGIEYLEREIGWDAIDDIDILDVKGYLEKQKEQKPVKCIDFDNEFENQVSHLLASVLNGEHEYTLGFVKHAAQSLLGYAKHELELDGKALLYTADKSYQIGFRDGVASVKPAEWSEEDENTIQEIIGCIEQARADSHLSEDHCLRLETFLYKHYRHSWKPSEEQMEALDKARRFIPYNCDALESLYNDLKKLT